MIFLRSGTRCGAFWFPYESPGGVVCIFRHDRLLIRMEHRSVIRESVIDSDAIMQL